MNSATNVNRKIYTVPELAEIMRIGKAAAYQLVKEPGFPAIKVGKRVVIPAASFFRWLERQAEGGEQF